MGLLNHHYLFFTSCTVDLRRGQHRRCSTIAYQVRLYIIERMCNPCKFFVSDDAFWNLNNLKSLIHVRSSWSSIESTIDGMHLMGCVRCYNLFEPLCPLHGSPAGFTTLPQPGALQGRSTPNTLHIACVPKQMEDKGVEDYSGLNPGCLGS